MCFKTICEKPETLNLFLLCFQIIMAKPAGGPKPKAGGNRDDD